MHYGGDATVGDGGSHDGDRDDGVGGAHAVRADGGPRSNVERGHEAPIFSALHTIGLIALAAAIVIRAMMRDVP